MSRQISIDNYFKTKSNLPSGIKIMNENLNVAKKRRTLSLLRTPALLKSPKYATQTKSPEKKDAEVICLSSDDENAAAAASSSPADETINLSQISTVSSGNESNSSETTIIYALTPSTPVKTPRKTPLKTPQTSDICQSPSSNKFFSPTKKRSILKRTPIKKNLAQQCFLQPEVTNDDDYFQKACEGMDDKSIFLLDIINKFLNDYTLTHLLMETSLELLTRCFLITKPGMRLVCRLYWRQPGWYRMEQLMQISGDKKVPIDEPTFMLMLNSLNMHNFISLSAITGNNSLSFEEYTKVLKADEMKQICKDLKLKIQSKQDAIEALSAFRRRQSISQYFTGGTSSNNSKRVLDMMRAKAGTCYKLSDILRNTIYKLYLLMYLGMNYSTIRDKQLELVLINNKINRETYPIDKEMELDSASVVFRSREEFAKYLQAHNFYENYVTETDSTKKCVIIGRALKMYVDINEADMMRYKTLPEWLRRFTPASLFVKILDSGVAELKKDKSGAHYRLALDILRKLIAQLAFRQHKKAEWYCESALILHKLLAKHDEAGKVLLQGLLSNLPEEQKDLIRPRALKLAKLQNIKMEPALRIDVGQNGTDNLIQENQFPADHVSKQPMENYKQRGKKKFEIHTEDDKKFLDCEEYCIIHYTTNGPFTHGEHWEGRIVTTIFFLLFWDIIYSKPVGVTGVFLSHYQIYPLDMFTESFYHNRKAMIDERLKKIESMAVNTLVETMRVRWEERPESELSGIARSIGWDNLRMVAGCLGAVAAAALCRRLATNYGYSRTGFPDLTLWNAATKKIKFVEVKTDTDKPSMKQLQWMKYLTANGIDCGFCYVGSHTTRCKARNDPTVQPPLKSVSRPVRSEPTSSRTVKSSPTTSRSMRTEPTVSRAMRTEPTVSRSIRTEPTAPRTIRTEPTVSHTMITEPNVRGATITESNVLEAMITEPNVLEAMITEPNVLEAMITEPNVLEAMITEPNVSGDMVTEPDLLEAMINEPNVLAAMINDPIASGVMLTESSKTLTFRDSIVFECSPPM